MGKALNKLKSYISNNKSEVLTVSVILLLASFLRLYNIRQFIIFLGDEGRDALVAKRMIVDHDLTLVGPTASVGGFYLGPIYYYFMVPFLIIFNLDPVGPAVMVALLGVATTFLVYLALKNWTSKWAASFTSLLYATSPGVVNNSRSSWNPNIMPFLSLLSIYAVTKGLKKLDKLWLITAGASFGVAIQSHYLGIIIAPILAIITFVSIPKSKWFKASAFQLVGFLIGGFTYLAFEIKVKFINLRNVIEFATRGGNTTGPRSLNLVWLLNDMLRRTFESVLPNLHELNRIMVLIVAVGFGIQVIKQKRSKNKLTQESKSILIWFLVGLLGIGSYKGQLYPHYFGFLFPLPFIMIGYTIHLLSKKYSLKIISTILLVILMVYNISSQKIWGQGSNLVNQTRRVTDEVIDLSEGEKFNFALISQGNSDHAYKYFLEISGNKPTDLEVQVTRQLIVVCENLEGPCEPRGHPLWEIAGFGRAEIVEEITVEPGIKVMKLIHHPESKDLIGKPAPKGG